MAAESKVLTYTVTPDGNGETLLDTFSPNSDELWYVDKATLESDGSGGTNSQGLTVSVGSASNESAADSNSAWTSLNPNSSTNTVDGDQANSSVTTLGSFLSSAQNLYIVFNDSSTGTDTKYITVELRRIL